MTQLNFAFLFWFLFCFSIYDKASPYTLFAFVRAGVIEGAVNLSLSHYRRVLLWSEAQLCNIIR
jgi:hypothetical protein